jgi:hypothetical protein
VGWIPAAYSAGARRPQGAMTTAGTTQARRALVEGAWAYRSPAKGSRPLPLRRAKPPKSIQDIRWKAQGRLWQRYRRLVARGKHANGVPVAMAREVAGCMWAIATEMPVRPSDQNIDSPVILHSEGVPTCIGKDAAPVWCHPRRREEASLGHSSRGRGRHPTEARQVGANPRRAAGSPVVSSWLRLF